MIKWGQLCDCAEFVLCSSVILAGAETDEFPRENLPMSIASTQSEYLVLTVPAHLDVYQLLSENTRDYLMNGSTAANAKLPNMTQRFITTSGPRKRHIWQTCQGYDVGCTGMG
jgi:hypothetical protein